ncbi:hypothetical protein GCM10010507_18330 [Streptomyces cinnamoneus]|uniref:Uncharacterized protein n=1 Tax=Streptomyces cinnamoneus TaxID=53446 RepID=A0A918TCY4_STRCJ|nr:hypothetical protein GCM10010507_18330 [Streptomyces cinnamoneus]
MKFRSVLSACRGLVVRLPASFILPAAQSARNARAWAVAAGSEGVAPEAKGPHPAAYAPPVAAASVPVAARARRAARGRRPGRAAVCEGPETGGTGARRPERR